MQMQTVRLVAVARPKKGQLPKKQQDCIISQGLKGAAQECSDVLEGQLPVSLLDLLLVRIVRHAQSFPGVQAAAANYAGCLQGNTPIKFHALRLFCAVERAARKSQTR